MKDKFEASLLESGDFIKKSAAALAENMGRAIAVITLIVSALVLFTDISFLDFGMKSFTSTMTVMLLASYVMYFSMEEAGERLGEESEEHKSAKGRLLSLTEKISGEKIEALRLFCKRYSEEELIYRRSNLLLSMGIGDEEYKAYKNGELTDKKSLRAMKKADKLKAYPLTPCILLSRGGKREASELLNPESHKLISMILKLIPTTVCTLLTVSVMFTAKDNIGIATVIDGLFKLSALIIIGFKGYTAGYCYSKHTLSLWLDTKARLIDAFLKNE